MGRLRVSNLSLRGAEDDFNIKVWADIENCEVSCKLTHAG